MASERFDTPVYNVIPVQHEDAEDGKFFPFHNPVTDAEGISMIVGLVPAADLSGGDHFKYLGQKVDPPVEVMPLHGVRGDKALWFDLSTVNDSAAAQQRLETVRQLMEKVINVGTDPLGYFEARYETTSVTETLDIRPLT